MQSGLIGPFHRSGCYLVGIGGEFAGGASHRKDAGFFVAAIDGADVEGKTEAEEGVAGLAVEPAHHVHGRPHQRSLIRKREKYVLYWIVDNFHRVD